MSGKSTTLAHKAMLHAMRNDGALIGVMVKTKSSAERGFWSLLTKRGGIVDQWIESGACGGYTVPPSFSQDSKTARFRVRIPPREPGGEPGESEFQLHSINREDQHHLEAQLKEGHFSMLLLIEFAHCKSRGTFAYLSALLRHHRIAYEQFQVLIDVNPPMEAKKHWLYPMFFEEDEPNRREFLVPIEDNIFISPAQKQQVYKDNQHDKNLLDRMYYGLWVEANSDGVFMPNFLPNIHVRGEIDPGDDISDHEQRDRMAILRPEDGAYQFEEGWDIGDRSLGYVMGVPRFIEDPGWVAYDIVDELCHSAMDVGLESMVDEVLNRREYWSNWQARFSNPKVPSIMWKSVSDSSSMRFRSNSRRSEAWDVSLLSGAQIRLAGVQKGAGTVGERRDLLNRLLFEKRIFISPLCPNVINMIKYIRSVQGYAIDPNSPHKHVFDALTYMLAYGIPRATRAAGMPDEPSNRSFTMA
jgi:hypothetical protein